MDINIIVDFLCEENDRLFPFIRTNKIIADLSEIGEYIKINLKPNINLEELSKELKVNIILINEQLEFNCLDYKYDKYICLIQHNDKYEFAYIKLGTKIIYIYKKDEIKNIKLNISNNQIDNSDNSDDYEEIIETENITIDDIVKTEDLQPINYNSVKDIIKKELGNDISTEDLNEIDELELTETLPEIKKVDGFIIPNEFIKMNVVELKKMLKNDIVAQFKKVNPDIISSKYVKITKEKLIEMIKK